MEKLSSEMKAAMLAELVAFMETGDHSWREEWYFSEREMIARVIERFFTEHLGEQLQLPIIPLRKVEPKVDRQELLNSLLPDVIDMMKGNQ